VENGIIVDPGGVAESMADMASLDAGVGGGCFIATAAFGSYMDTHVKLLRDFRDEYLLDNTPGKWFVERYYRYGPHGAEYIQKHEHLYIQKHEHLRPVVRLALMPLVGLSYILLRANWSLLITSALLLVMLTLAYYRSRIKQKPKF
jgi:hypothetical protein